MGPEILIVGDRAVRGELVPRVQDLGYSVSPVRERELLLRVARSPGPAAVIVCLGETDATNLVRTLRRSPEGSAVPVLLYGRLGGELRDLADVLELGADRFLEAPVADAELVTALAELAGPAEVGRSDPPAEDAQRAPHPGRGHPVLGKLHRTLEVLAARLETQDESVDSHGDGIDLDAMGLDAVPDVDSEHDSGELELLRESTQRLPPKSSPRGRVAATEVGVRTGRWGARRELTVSRGEEISPAANTRRAVDANSEHTTPVVTAAREDVRKERSARWRDAGLPREPGRPPLRAPAPEPPAPAPKRSEETWPKRHVSGDVGGVEPTTRLGRGEGAEGPGPSRVPEGSGLQGRAPLRVSEGTDSEARRAAWARERTALEGRAPPRVTPGTGAARSPSAGAPAGAAPAAAPARPAPSLPPLGKPGSRGESDAPTLLAELRRERFTGCLQATGREGPERRLWWSEGQVIGGASAAVNESVLGRLAARGLIAATQLELAVRWATGDPRRDLERLAQAGLIKPQEMQEALREPVRRVVERIAESGTIAWGLHPGEAPPVQVELGVPLASLLATGVRRGAPLSQLRETVGDGRRPRLSFAGPEALAAELRWPEMAAIAGRFDGRTSVGELVAEAVADEQDVRAAVHVLGLLGHLAPEVDDPEASLAAVDRRRVRERLRLARENDYFALLGLPREASRAEVLCAHADLSATFREGLEPSSKVELVAEVEEVLAALDEARDVLADDALHTAYLAQLAARRAAKEAP